MERELYVISSVSDNHRGAPTGADIGTHLREPYPNIRPRPWVCVPIVTPHHLSVRPGMPPRLADASTLRDHRREHIDE